MLESLEHGDNAFLTLTYRDEDLPRLTNGLSTLAPEDVRNWLKRFRKELSPQRVRYYVVGEYGDESFRPHYHAALFGVRCFNGQTYTYRGRPMADRCCASCRLVSRTWARGDVSLGSLEESSAQYLAGYVTKKMTRFDDARLEGRHPEFARMSLRPGIGFGALWEIADVVMSLDLDESEADVPSALRHGKRIWPLGRYLKSRLRLMVGKEEGAPEKLLQEIGAKLLPLREAAKRSKDNPSFKRQVVEAFAQDALNLETRHKIFRKRGLL